MSLSDQTPEHTARQVPLALIGMACRLPGADGLEQFWELLHSGKSAIDVLPPERLDQDLYYDPTVGRRGRSYSRIAGIIALRDPDLRPCTLSADMARSYDPCHLALLAVAESACRNAGLDPGHLPHRHAGVFIGHSRPSKWGGELSYSTQIEQTLESLRDVDAFQRTLGSAADDVLRGIVAHVRGKYPHRELDGRPWLEPHRAATLLSQTLGLTGPAMVINAACASGLAALAMAAWSLEQGSIDLAVVGSASHVHFSTLVLFSQARSLSAKGSCPFDAAADGLVASEGYVVFLVKTLSRALADRDRIQAVIEGIGLATDGRGKSLWAPRKEGQVAAMRRAYGGHLPESSLQYVEAHATSTQVGDATELAALSAAVGERLAPGVRIPLGSVKSNIGHTLETAGLAGLLKVVLAMQHGRIPGTINLRQLNPHIAWESSPFYVPTATQRWPQPASGQPRRAAVNAFGVGGLNVHVVVREPGTLPDPATVSVDGSEMGVGSDAPARMPPGVAIVGMGAVLPGALNIEAFWDLLVTGRVALSQVPASRWRAEVGCDPRQPALWRSTSSWGGFITDFQPDWRKHKIPPKQIASADPLQMMILEAVDQALADAGYPDRAMDRTRTAVVVGARFQGEYSLHLGTQVRLAELERTLADALSQRSVPAATIREIVEQFGDKLLQRVPALLDETGSFSSSSLASRVTKTFDLQGGAIILDAGGASGAAALLVAAEMLRAGVCDTVICGAGERDLGLVAYERLSLSGQLARDHRRGPLDADAHGFVPGEGAAALVLRRHEDAERDGQAVRSIIRSIACARAESLFEAVEEVTRRTLGTAGCMDGVRLVESSALGLPEIDRAECEALSAAYGASPDRPLHLGTLAGQIGYISSAWGLIAVIKATLALQRQHWPGCAGLESPARFLSAPSSGLAVSPRTAALPTDSGEEPSHAGVSCHDLANAAYHIILERSTPVGTWPVIHLYGDAFEMGRQHGAACADDIRRVLRRYADGAHRVGVNWRSVRELVSQSKLLFGTEDLLELEGVAAGARVNLESLLAHNLRLFPDLDAGCSHFAVSSAANHEAGLVHAANEDLPLGLLLRESLVRHLQLRAPAGKFPHLLFGAAGGVAGINGINARGLAVTSAMLLDVPKLPHVRPGWLHATLVKRILEQAADISSAIAVIRRAPRMAAGWGVCISQHTADELCYIEYVGETIEVRRGLPRVTAGNRASILEPRSSPPAHCELRLSRLASLLADPAAAISAERAQRVLRDRFDMQRNRETVHATMNTVRRVDNQYSLVVQPAGGRLWVTAPAAAGGSSEQFVSINLRELFSRVSQPEARAAAATSSETRIEASTRTGGGEATAEQGTLAAPHAVPALPAEGTVAPVCRRFVLRLRESPLSFTAPAKKRLPEAAIVCGKNPLADAMCLKLRNQGTRVLSLDSTKPLASLVAQLEEAWRDGAIPHLFLLTPHDPQAVAGLAEGSCVARLQAGVLTPYFFCQRWFQLVQQAGFVDRATVLACTTLGGDFGLTSHVTSAEGGALSGLMKALHVEVTRQRRSQFSAKVVDVGAGQTSEQAAATILREYLYGDSEAEVAYPAETRYVVRPVLAPLAVPSPPARRPDGVWVVTGGARGITAVVARELGRRFQLRLHLLGSSPSPQVDPAWRSLSTDGLRSLRTSITREALERKQVPVEAWKRVEKALEIDRNLHAFFQSGVRATYHSCSVRDRQALARVLAEIRAQDGPITGVLHGAGFESALRFENKKAADVEATVLTKIAGAATLMELTRQDPLRWFLAFGSISGRFGGTGQTDYCLANDLLAKLVDWFRQSRPDCRSTTFHWHSWDEVGMAVRPESRHIKDALLVRYMPTREGAAHVVAELEAGLPEPEVLITDESHIRKYYPAILDAGLARPLPRAATAPGTELALIGTAARNGADGSLTANVELDPCIDPFLVQHRLRHRPVLPLVVSLEAMAEAASLVTPGKALVGFRDVTAAKALVCYTERTVHARVRTVAVETEAETGVQCRFLSDFANTRGQVVSRDVLHAQAAVLFADVRQSWPSPPIVEPPTWHTAYYPDREALLYHGPVFRRLRRVAFDDTGMWGEIEAGPTVELGGARRPDRWLFCPAVLDACLFACGIHYWLRDERAVVLPSSIGHLRLARLPADGERCIVRIVPRGVDRSQPAVTYARYNVVVQGADGGPLFELLDYHAMAFSGKGL